MYDHVTIKLQEWWGSICSRIKVYKTKTQNTKQNNWCKHNENRTDRTCSL